MIIGIHTLIYSNDADKDRASFRDVLGFKGIELALAQLLFPH